VVTGKTLAVESNAASDMTGSEIRSLIERLRIYPATAPDRRTMQTTGSVNSGEGPGLDLEVLQKLPDRAGEAGRVIEVSDVSAIKNSEARVRPSPGHVLCACLSGDPARASPDE
jgi:hypothetical protein